MPRKAVKKEAPMGPTMEQLEQAKKEILETQMGLQALTHQMAKIPGINANPLIQANGKLARARWYLEGQPETDAKAS